MLGRGTVRASVLEVRYVSAEGCLIRAGGPTVKNVTGFDLPRILTGSLGTLGLFAELILRTNPIPAATVWVVAEGADPFTTRDHLVGSSTVLWDGARTWVGIEGHAPDVTAQLIALKRVGHFTETDGPPPLPPQRWSLTPADVRTLAGHDTGAFVASIGVGVVHAERPQPPRTLPPPVAELAARLKANFDPTGRLNPGRDPGRR